MQWSPPSMTSQDYRADQERTGDPIARAIEGAGVAYVGVSEAAKGTKQNSFVLYVPFVAPFFSVQTCLRSCINSIIQTSVMKSNQLGCKMES